MLDAKLDFLIFMHLAYVIFFKLSYKIYQLYFYTTILVTGLFTAY
jgi:hypothetical protein